MTAQLLIVRAEGHRLGLPLELVDEIVDRGAVITLPRRPAAIAGVIAVRGVAVPLLDAGALAGGEMRRDRRTIVVGRDGRRPVALLVDDVEGIVDTAEADGPELLDLRTLLERLA